MWSYRAYPTRLRWGRVFLPHREAIQPFVTEAVRLVDPQFDPETMIPRDVGRPFDYAMAPTRTCARTYQMFGYCHIVAAFMLPWAQLALPRMKWVVLSAVDHSVVAAARERLVIDLNHEWPGPRLCGPRESFKAPREGADLHYFREHVLESSSGFCVYEDYASYMDRLRWTDWSVEWVKALGEQGEGAFRVR